MIEPRIEAAALALLLAFSATPAFPAPLPGADAGNKNVVAMVGERAITREDLTHMMQIEKFYKSPALSETDALVIVVQDAIANEVARSAGLDITLPIPPANFPFVKQFTPPGKEDFKAQGTLPAKDQAFHVNDAAYAQLYVIPKIIDRKLRLYFRTTADIHRNERARIEQAHRLVNSGMSFAESARTAGLMAAQRELENKAIELPAALIPKLPADRRMQESDGLIAILDQLSPGEINPKIIEDDDSYRVLRLISRNGQKYTIETIEAVKPRFETWLKERARTLRITIKDAALKREIKRAYPGIDWVGRL